MTLIQVKEKRDIPENGVLEYLKKRNHYIGNFKTQPSNGNNPITGVGIVKDTESLNTMTTPKVGTYTECF